VQTVIIAYVTVPALSSFPSSARQGNGLKSTSGDMEDLLKRYTVREVVLVSTSTGAFAESAEPLWTSEEKGLMGTKPDARCALPKL
jgi:hypothetical protein